MKAEARTPGGVADLLLVDLDPDRTLLRKTGPRRPLSSAVLRTWHKLPPFIEQERWESEVDHHARKRMMAAGLVTKTETFVAKTTPSMAFCSKGSRSG